MKQKRPEKELVWAVMACWCCALPLFALSAWAFVNKSGFVINRETVPIETYNTVLKWALFTTIELPLILGVAFLGSGYMVWNAYRKIKAAAAP